MQNGSLKRCRIEPQRRPRVWYGHRLAGYEIRPLPQSIVILGIAALGNVEGEAAGDCNNAAELPSAENRSRCGTKTSGHRNLPDVTDNQPMALIQYAAGPFGRAPVARILTGASAAIDRLAGIIDQVRPGVSSGETQSMREAVLVPGLERVVDRVRIRRDHPDARVLRIRAARLDRSRPRIRLVEILQAGVDVSSFAADPPRFHHVVVGQLPRPLQVEVLHICVA